MADTEQHHLFAANLASESHACAEQGHCPPGGGGVDRPAERNSQPPVHSVCQCTHFQLANLRFAVDLHEEQLGRVCVVLPVTVFSREQLRGGRMNFPFVF
jgi:hypothetical protein